MPLEDTLDALDDPESLHRPADLPNPAVLSQGEAGVGRGTGQVGEVRGELMGLVPHSHHGLVSGYLGTVVSQSVRASKQHRSTNVSRHGGPIMCL